MSSDVPRTPPNLSSAGATTTSASVSASASGRAALNASHIEVRRQRKKIAIKKLEKKLENYHRQIMKLVGHVNKIHKSLRGWNFMDMHMWLSSLVNSHP